MKPMFLGLAQFLPRGHRACRLAGMSEAEPVVERRKDRRIGIDARVRLRPQSPDPLGVLEGDLVDVSAGGLRAHTFPPPHMEVGEVVRVEIELPAPEGEPHGPGEVHLRGEGVVVRVENDPLGHGAALRFSGPLEVRDRFAELLVV